MVRFILSVVLAACLCGSVAAYGIADADADCLMEYGQCLSPSANCGFYDGYVSNVIFTLDGLGYSSAELSALKITFASDHAMKASADASLAAGLSEWTKIWTDMEHWFEHAMSAIGKFNEAEAAYITAEYLLELDYYDAAMIEMMAW